MMSCGENRHGEIRYYLVDGGSQPFYYADELAPAKRRGRGRGWGKKHPKDSEENG